MDKKLNRVIGYRPNIPDSKEKNDATKETIETTVAPIENTRNVNVAEFLADELGKVNKIVKWINGHPEFKWGVMCKKIGIDKGNFQRTLKSDEPKIKIEYISPIEDFIKNYGYAG